MPDTASGSSVRACERASVRGRTVDDGPPLRRAPLVVVRHAHVRRVGLALVRRVPERVLAARGGVPSARQRVAHAGAWWETGPDPSDTNLDGLGEILARAVGVGVVLREDAPVRKRQRVDGRWCPGSRNGNGNGQGRRRCSNGHHVNKTSAVSHFLPLRNGHPLFELVLGMYSFATY